MVGVIIFRRGPSISSIERGFSKQLRMVEEVSHMSIYLILIFIYETLALLHEEPEINRQVDYFLN